MTTFTWNPPAAVTPVDWNTPSYWLPMSVPNSSDADVIIPEITTGGGAPFSSYVTVENTESYIVHSLTLDHQGLVVNGSLSVVSDLTMELGSGLSLSGSLSVGSVLTMAPGTDLSLTAGSLTLGSLSNADTGYTIDGSGQISSPGTIDNQGAILAGLGTLTLDFAGLQNAGLLFVDGDMEVDVGSGPGAFTNLPSGTLFTYAGTLDVNAVGFLSDGTLSGGTYEVNPSAIINFNAGGDITADAATIILDANGATPLLGLETEVDGVEHPLAETLRSITRTGVLTLNGGVFADVGPLTVDGIVQLEANAFSAPELTIQPGGSFGGNGSITGSVTNDGTLTAYASTYASNFGSPNYFQPGANLLIDGSVAGTGTMAILSGDRGLGVVPPTVLEIVGAATNAVTFGNDWNGVLLLDSPASLPGPISGFTIGRDFVENMNGEVTSSFLNSDTLILGGLSASAITNLAYNGTVAGGTLSFDDAGSSIALNFVGNYSLGEFVLGPGPRALSTSPPSVEISLDTTLCFLAGTMIATQAGETPVEQLAVGELVRTAGGDVRPITWIGKGDVLVTRGRRNAATPVIVRKGALADNVPHQDLRVTKGHSLYLDGVLIPVEFIVNHRSICWDDHAQEVSLYHIELGTHDVLVANGAPAESYRDDGNRWLFQNANTGWGVPPKPPCAPVLTGGDVVDRVWLRLLGRAGPRNAMPLTNDPDLHLLLDGKRIDAIERRDDAVAFRLATRPYTARICSRSAMPQELGIARDDRQLGVAVRRIVLVTRTRRWIVESNAESLADGYHAFEPENGIRWTDGNAAIPAKLVEYMNEPAMLIVHLGGVTQYLDEGTSARAA